MDAINDAFRRMERGGANAARRAQPAASRGTGRGWPVPSSAT
jgi:hypothetical protein